MKVDLKDKKLIIRFTYGVKDCSSRYTKCDIIELDGTRNADAIVYCHPEKDKFQKKVGRKFALRRALAFYGFSREDRTVIWSQVLKQMGV
jgi:hypothetical protein